MPDILSPQQRHQCMSHIRSTSTKPEVKMRHELWRRGFRYRVNDKRLPGSPDIVFPRYRTVVFVHGCFWHGHIGCKKYRIPQTNIEYWTDKVTRNQERDQEVWRKLEAKGWEVIIVWECELDNKKFDETMSRVEKRIKDNGRLYEQRKQERRILREQYLTERRSQKDKYSRLLKNSL